jgi:hypothetical protein
VALAVTKKKCEEGHEPRRRCFPAPPPERCGAPRAAARGARTQASEPSHSAPTWRRVLPSGTGTCPGALNLGRTKRCVHCTHPAERGGGPLAAGPDRSVQGRRIQPLSIRVASDTARRGGGRKGKRTLGSTGMRRRHRR